MEIGQRVEVRHLLHNGPLFGKITAFLPQERIWFGVYKSIGLATVELDNQIRPLTSVLVYEKYHVNAMIPAAYWQYCWPINEST